MNNILNISDFINENRSDRVMSAKDLLEKDFGDVLEFTGKWEAMFGKPSPNFTMMLTGAPFSGKTSLLLELSYYMASEFGKTLYISTEEYGSITLKNKLSTMVKKSGLKDENGEVKFFVPNNLYFSKGMTDLTDYKFIIIDSVSDVNMDIEDFKELSDIYEKKAFILVMQSTKAGDFRGSKEWEHEVDIYSRIDSGIVTTFKNRFIETKDNLRYDYFNDKPVKKDE